MIERKEYWEKRAIEITEAGEKSALDMLKDVKRIYDDAAMDIQKEVDNFHYKYFGADEPMTLSGIKINLTEKELYTMRKEVERYLLEIERTGGFNTEYREYLRYLSKRVKAARQEELRLQLRRISENAYQKINSEFTKGLGGTYGESYLRSIFNIQQGIGTGNPFTALSNNLIVSTIREPWLGSNFSERLWTHMDSLLQSLDNTFMKGVALGWNPNKTGRAMAKEVTTKFDNKHIRSNCVRLAHTEFMNAVGQATLDSYRETAVDKYRFVATLDEVTCEICGPLDLDVFEVAEAVKGINYPPEHPRCRCTTIPYFELSKGVTRFARIGRDTFEVPSTLTYEEWRESLTEEQGKMFKKKGVKRLTTVG